jgi:uncharacterized protein YecE (DUF72 family)
VRHWGPHRETWDHAPVIRVGTAGFAYKDWEGPVYPSPKPKGFDPLRFLAGFFPCIEMNVSFYRVPTPENVAKWVGAVADVADFRFTFKLYRGVTHGDEDEAIGPFLAALEPCRDAGRLGAVLLQFPFYFRNTQENRGRLAFLAQKLAGWPLAVEVRDRSWLVPPALDFFRRNALNLCDIDICQTRSSIPPGAWTTGPLGYVRFHGRNRDAWFDKNAPRDSKYDYLYSKRELAEWAEHVKEIAAQADSTYVIMNNHFAGKAVANAFQLQFMLTGESPEPPAQLKEAYPS